MDLYCNLNMKGEVYAGPRRGRYKLLLSPLIGTFIGLLYILFYIHLFIT